MPLLLARGCPEGLPKGLTHPAQCGGTLASTCTASTPQDIAAQDLPRLGSAMAVSLCWLCRTGSWSWLRVLERAGGPGSGL